MQEQNTRILELIDAANQSITDETESHQVLMQGDILAMFDEVDMLITDVSSVGLDFLYLHPTKPLVLTDRRNNIDKLTGEAPISRATPIIDGRSVENAFHLLHSAFTEDTNAEARTILRAHYFGEGEKGTSTRLFTEAISYLIENRTHDLKGFSDTSTNAESNDGDDA